MVGPGGRHQPESAVGTPSAQDIVGALGPDAQGLSLAPENLPDLFDLTASRLTTPRRNLSSKNLIFPGVGKAAKRSSSMRATCPIRSSASMTKGASANEFIRSECIRTEPRTTARGMPRGHGRLKRATQHPICRPKGHSSNASRRPRRVRKSRP